MPQKTLSKLDAYRLTLRELPDWTPFLLAESNLPGPRGNLELAHAAAREGDESHFRAWLAAGVDAEDAPRAEFLPFCALVGFGYLLAQAPGRADLWELLRVYASHPLWRLREAVATGLQYVGDRDMPALLHQMRGWAAGSLLEQRAAAAALCEPRLLARPEDVRSVLELLDSITTRLPAAAEGDAPGWQVLRQGLGYCWSVAVAALPSEGKPYIERWLESADANVRWIMRENLRKARLDRMDHAWVAHQAARLG